MTRLVLLCLVPLLLALPAGADCLDDIKAELAAIRQKLAMGEVPPVVVPPVVTPTTPAGAGGSIALWGEVRTYLPANVSAFFTSAARITVVPMAGGGGRNVPTSISINGGPAKLGSPFMVPAGSYTLTFSGGQPGVEYSILARPQ